MIANPYDPGFGEPVENSSVQTHRTGYPPVVVVFGAVVALAFLPEGLAVLLLIVGAVVFGCRALGRGDGSPADAAEYAPHPDGAPDREHAWQIAFAVVFVAIFILIIALNAAVLPL